MSEQFRHRDLRSLETLPTLSKYLCDVVYGWHSLASLQSMFTSLGSLETQRRSTSCVV